MTRAENMLSAIRTHWANLTEHDVERGLKHRHVFLELLRDRHHLHIDEAEKQLEAFQEQNPTLMFEKS